MFYSVEVIVVVGERTSIADSVKLRSFLILVRPRRRVVTAKIFRLRRFSKRSAFQLRKAPARSFSQICERFSILRNFAWQKA